MRNKIPYFIIVILLVLLVYNYSKNQRSSITPEANQTLTKFVGLCTRATPYNNPPELTRALGFGYEKDIGASNAPTPPPGSYGNCIHLIYKDHNEMNGAEGFFSFDNKSNANDLRIYVDSTYKGYDDILTASLLTHELRHITFFVKYLNGTPLPTCVDNEAAAFYSQLVFLSNLNAEEWKSITYRVGQNPHLNSAYEITYYLLRLNKVARDACPTDPNQTCWNNYVLENLTSWVKSIPYYQKQCNI